MIVYVLITLQAFYCVIAINKGVGNVFYNKCFVLTINESFFNESMVNNIDK